MNVNIETNTTQQVTSAELDELAKNLCGVRLTTADDGVPTVDVDSISVDGINATSSDGVYGDTKEALAELGVNVSANVEKQRVLDPEVLRVLLTKKTHANEGYFTVLEFENITSVLNIFSNNKNITEFTELVKTSITSLLTNSFRNSSIKVIDLSKIERIGDFSFYDARELTDIGDISNIELLDAGCFDRNAPFSSKYAYLVLPKVVSIDKTCNNSNGKISVPSSVQYLYCPICLYAGSYSITSPVMEYLYLPSLLVASRGSWSNATGYTTNLKIISIGKDLQSFALHYWMIGTNVPDASIILHGINIIDSSNVTSASFASSKPGHFFLLPEQANSFSLNANFTSYSDSVLIIGSEDWKTQMLVYATDRGYTLPDEYTDFYYEYIDYMLGDIPVPPAHFKAPEEIKIYTRYGELSDNDEICDANDEVEIILYVDSYRNASTLSISNNNAGVTLNNRKITIPSVANGETVTITATNNYDNTVTKSVTIKCYGYMNKGMSGISQANQKIILNKLFKQKMYLTLTDLAGLTAIHDSAFENSALTEADWLLYTSVTSIGNNAFDGCASLSSVNIPSGVTSIGNSAFRSCTGLTSINIPEGVTSIGITAFQYCGKLTSITIPNSVTSIGITAFHSCGLTSITIGNGVTSIGLSVFAYCGNLTSVTIPNSVTSVGNYAFVGCNRLSFIIINATIPPTLGGNVFLGTNNCPIYVPAGSVSAYQTATNWSTYASRIQAIPTT